MPPDEGLNSFHMITGRTGYLLLALAAVILAGAVRRGAGARQMQKLTITSSAFTHSSAIPSRHKT